MENRKAKMIHQIERLLGDSELLEEQRQTLEAFDRFNELEAQCRLSTRHGYIQTLHELGTCVQKLFEEMTREDLQVYLSEQKRHHRPSVVQLQKTHLKRFYRFVEMRRVNEGRAELDKVDIRAVKAPYVVNWIRTSFKPEEIPFEELPAESEILRMAQNVDRQRDRALILVTWESGASPVEILSLRIGNVLVNKYGATLSFPRFVNSKAKQPVELKTDYRFRRIPVATSVPDLLSWLSMHPMKNDPNAPLWISQKGGNLSYAQFHRILQKAWQRAGIKKPFNPYALRHLRLTQVAQVLPEHELKVFAGHARARIAFISSLKHPMAPIAAPPTPEA